MPVSLFSSTGSLQFRPCRLLPHPVLIDPDYVPPSPEPDEIIDPSIDSRRQDSTGRIRACLAVLFIFGLLQAAALVPPLYMVRLLPV